MPNRWCASELVRLALAPNVDRDDVPLAALEQGVDLALEVLDALKALVHACEADVGDLVELVELGHRELAHLRGLHLGHALAAELGLDLVRRLLGGAVQHWPARQRLPKPVRELVAVELLARAVALDDKEARGLDALVRGEPGAAGGALAPRVDGRRVVEVTRVDDPRVALAADGTSHPVSSLPAPLLVVVREDDTTSCRSRDQGRAC